MRLPMRAFVFGFAFDGFGIDVINPAQPLAQAKIADSGLFLSCRS